MNSTHHRAPTRLIGVVLLGAALSGCGLSKPYPEKNLYAFSVPPSTTAEGAQSRQTLQVENVQVAVPFDGTSFIYQTGPSQYSADYYNGFIAPPGRLLTSVLCTWLARSGVYGTVLASGTAASSQMSLESNVRTLCADYSVHAAPKAVMEIRFFVIGKTNEGYPVLLDKTYHEVEPMDSATPEAMVNAWNKCLGRICAELVTDIRATPAAMNGTPTLLTQSTEPAGHTDKDLPNAR